MTPLPGKLTLEFSRAADKPRLMYMFNPAVKNVSDPNGFVAQREPAVIDHALARGGVLFLNDEHGEAQTVTATYHLHDKNQPRTQRHRYTEVGTTLARLPGFNSARLAITAMTLKEWWTAAPRERFIAEIDVANSGSLHTFFNGLKWKHVTDKNKTTALQSLCDEGLAPSERGLPVEWFTTTPAVLKNQARILLDFMDQGGLINKKTGTLIPVDFSALDHVGLTRKRLEAMAAGTLKRRDLLAIQP